jgi:hypothetical protein
MVASGLLCAVPMAVAQTGQLPLMYANYASTEEGDSGLTNVTMSWYFSTVAPTDAAFTYQTVPTMPLDAEAGSDYVAVPPTRVVVPKGQSRGEITFQVRGDTEIELSEHFAVRFSGFSGIMDGDAPSYIEQNIQIANDDEPPLPPLSPKDDYLFFNINEDPIEIRPEQNDIATPDRLRGATTVATSQPLHGTLVQDDSGYTEFPRRFFYAPDPDFSGRDEFTYRLCKADGDCVDAKVVLQGYLRPPFEGGNARLGYVSANLRNLPPLVRGRFEASSLAEAREITLRPGVDSTPHDAWDSREGLAWSVGTLPASPDGQPRHYRVFVDAVRSDLAMELLAGRDADGDGAPSRGEQECLASGAMGTLATCELAFEVGASPVRYWVAVHSRSETAIELRPQVYEVAMDHVDGRLLALGPVTTRRDDPVRVRVAWRDPFALYGDWRMGYVTVFDGERRIGDFRVQMGGSSETPLFFPANDSVTQDFPANHLERYFFVDVPNGASSLAVTLSSDRPIQAKLQWFGLPNPIESRIEGFPGDVDGSWTTVQAGQPKTLQVSAPLVGRWHVAIKTGLARSRVQATNRIQAVAPVVRPGSYFNDRQPGSGLILYPAGNQWAGLWYTYWDGSRPTWFYLQGPKPGEDGIWRSPIYLSSWDGERSKSTVIGELQLVQGMQDWVLVSYHFNGQTGSQRLIPLGRGCPSLGGQVLDISSHWFDPARAGTGYSVQVWENYEFYAAFMYDRQGEPVFLAAEGAFAPTAEADFPLEVLNGSCPVCGGGLSPRRRPAGVLRRVVNGDTLQRVELLVDYEELAPLSGRRTWSVADHVQTLGGPGSTQGCTP